MSFKRLVSCQSPNCPACIHFLARANRRIDGVISIPAHRRHAFLGLDHAVPGVVGAGEANRRISRLRHRRHVAVAVVRRRDPGWTCRLGDVGDLINLVHRTGLVEIGGIRRFLNEVGPVAEGIERPIFLVGRSSGDSGLVGVEIAAVEGLEAVQTVVSVVFVEILAVVRSNNVFFPDV